jgi:hypothetical protein
LHSGLSDFLANAPEHAARIQECEVAHTPRLRPHDIQRRTVLRHNTVRHFPPAVDIVDQKVHHERISQLLSLQAVIDNSVSSDCLK